MHYRKHIFCCVNERTPDHPRSCCYARGSVRLRTYMKKRAKGLGLTDIRINNAGCLERCEFGPTMVVYPEGVWYHYETFEDVDEILDQHIIGDEYVHRLMLEDGQAFPEPPAYSRLKLRVSSVESSISGTLRVEFVNAANHPLPEFSAGAHIDLIIEDYGFRRSYSLINHPRERHRYVIGISLDCEGRGGSKWLHDNLKTGQTIEAGHPINSFELAESAASHLLIARGIGVTPILSMCHRLRELNAEFRVHYFDKSESDGAFVEELNDACGEQLSCHYDDGHSDHRLIAEKILSNSPQGEHLYVCGPLQFMDDVINAAGAWPKKNIHMEWFNRRVPKSKRNEAFYVVLARRKTVLRVDANESILDALKRADIVSEHSCEGGLCGVCRTRVLYGDVEHRDMVLSNREKTHEKLMMICVSRAAAGADQLVLDI